MSRKKAAIGCSLLLFSCGVCIIMTMIHSWLYPPFFSRFPNEAHVGAYITSILIPGEATLTDVQNHIDSGTFGYLECHPSPYEDETLACLAIRRAEFFSTWYYSIVFSFEDEILMNVEVYIYWLGL
jgi:hypothetical protein